MTNTKWKNTVKEGFKEGATDKQENIIWNRMFGSPTTDLSQNEPNPPSFYDRLSNLSSNFNSSDAKNIYTDFIKSAKMGTDGIKDIIAGIISGISPSSTNDDKGKISRQVAMWIAVIPASYWFVINWWYVLCYTNFTIDFRKFIWTPAHWVIAPVLHAIELLNYYTITFRMDVDSKITAEFSRRIWNIRPIIFSIFHCVMVIIMLSFSATDAAMGSMLNTGMTYIVASLLSMYYFVSLFNQEKWYQKFLDSGSIIAIIGGIGLTVLSFICMFVFLCVVCPLFTLYISFLSYFVLLAFNKFWPPSVISICQQIFQELKEAPVDDPIDKWGKFKNAAFQNAHSIYLLFIIFTILTVHINAAMTFSSNSLMVVAILLNILLARIFAPSAFYVVFELLNILLEEDSSKKDDSSIAVPESTILSTE